MISGAGRVAGLSARPIAVALALVCAGSAGAQTDACGSATLVTVPATVTGTVVGATADGADSCTTCTGPDVWVSFVPPVSQAIIANLCGGATWDTVLSLHTGCPGVVGNEVACSDDYCGDRSHLRANVIAGTTYYLRIAGWCGATGSFTLGLSYQATILSGPDVIVGDINSTSRYAPEGAITAYALGATSCNIGTADANWDADTPGHPLIHQAMFRLKSGRFEQVGQAWLKHTFGTVDNAICGVCNGHLGQILGVGCSDPYVASQSGDRNLLGPKWQVNATTGVYDYPFASPPWSGTTARRLQVLTSDIDPAQNAGALYFAEVHYVTADDAQVGNGLNNATYRRISFATAVSTPALAGATVRKEPAISAWKATDPAVTQVNADYLDQGIVARFIVSAKATDAGGGNWDYEYAVCNLNSHRSAQAFSVAIGAGAVPSNIGFHDVPYHSGDGIAGVNYDGTDWPVSTAGGRLTWATQTIDANPNANALRWGTLYNFRFRIGRAPTTGSATVTLFRPGAAGEPADLKVSGLPVPAVPCAADFNGVGGLSVQDIFDYLAAYFAGC